MKIISNPTECGFRIQKETTGCKCLQTQSNCNSDELFPINCPLQNSTVIRLENQPIGSTTDFIIKKQSEPDIDDAEMSFNEHFEKELMYELMYDYISFANYFYKWKEKIQRGVAPIRPDEVFREWQTSDYRKECKEMLKEKKDVNIEKQSEPAARKTAEIPSDIISKMQHEFEPNPDTSFKQGMYSGYAFGLQDGYKFASQSLPEITDDEIEKEQMQLREINSWSYNNYTRWIEGAKWYRNEIKSRQ